MNVDAILEQVLANEGGYNNNLNDSGGPTNFGITEKVARANGYQGDMRDFTKEQALEIYRRQYVEGPGFNFIMTYSEAIAEELVDTGVNMGVKQAGMFLQRSLNVLTDSRLYVDGICGPATREALRRFLVSRPDDGEKVMLKALNCLQGARYIELAEGNAKNKSFIFGWLRTRVSI